MKNVQFVPNQLQDLISAFQVATRVKEMFILSRVRRYIIRRPHLVLAYITSTLTVIFFRKIAPPPPAKHIPIGQIQKFPVMDF